MELEDLKKGWKEMETRIDRLEEQLTFERKKRMSSARDRLVLRFRIMATVCFLLPASFTSLMGTAQFSERSAIYFALFCFIMGIFTAWEASRIKRLDLQRSSLKETLVNAEKAEKLFRQKPLVGLVLATPVLISMMADMFAQDDKFVFYAAGGGLFIGAILGLNIRRRVMLDFKQMRQALEEEIGE